MKTNKPLDMLKLWLEKLKFTYLKKVKKYLEKRGYICEGEPKCVNYNFAISFIFIFYYIASIIYVIFGKEDTIVMLLNLLCLTKAILVNAMRQYEISDIYRKDGELTEYNRVRHPYSERAKLQGLFEAFAILCFVLSVIDFLKGITKLITCLAIIEMLWDEYLNTMEYMFKASANYKEKENEH